MIFAKKGVLIRTFPENQWKLMGRSKNDWEQITESEYNQLASQKKTVTAKKVTIPGFPNSQGQVAVAQPNKFEAIDLTVKKNEEEEKARLAQLDKDRTQKLKALGASDLQIQELRKMVNIGALNDDEFNEIYNQAKETIAAENGGASNEDNKDEKTENNGDDKGETENTTNVDNEQASTFVPSSQFAVKGAKDHIDTLTDVADILAFIKGDERKSVKDHAANAAKKLK